MYNFEVNFINFICDTEVVIISPNQFPVDILKMIIKESTYIEMLQGNESNI